MTTPLDLSWTMSYLREPVSTLGTYVALLLLRFERRSNYERVIDLEELLSQAKLSLRNLLGGSAAYRAYETGLRFLQDFFTRFPEALQARPRFRLLESIESQHYDIFKRYYLTAVLSNLEQLDIREKVLLYRVAEGVRSGKVPLIDKTACGSAYMLKTDLLYYAAGIRQLEHMLELQHIFARGGVLLPEYPRVIMPAPLTEDIFLRQLLRREPSLNLVSSLTKRLNILGYSLARTYTLAISTGTLLVLDYRKQVIEDFTIRARFYIAPELRLDNPSDYARIYQDSIMSPRPNIVVVICKSADDNIRRLLSENSMLLIETGELDISRTYQYIVDKITKALLDIAASSVMHEMIKLLQDLYTTLFEM